MPQENNNITDFIHAVSGLNSRLVRSGDILMHDYGLTNARWRVMQSIRRSGVQTVARIARAIELKRQGVQRIVNELEQEGFVRLIDNPDHKRARLVQPTAAGAAALDAVSRRYDGWAGALEQKFTPERLAHLARDLRAFQDLLMASSAPDATEEAARPNGQDQALQDKSAAASARLPDTPLWP